VSAAGAISIESTEPSCKPQRTWRLDGVAIQEPLLDLGQRSLEFRASPVHSSTPVTFHNHQQQQKRIELIRESQPFVQRTLYFKNMMKHLTSGLQTVEKVKKGLQPDIPFRNFASRRMKIGGKRKKKREREEVGKKNRKE
jgi:hypothetical protein